MLDIIQYVKNPDGTISKTVTHTETVKDLKAELVALKSQLTDLEASISALPDNVGEVVSNYKEQIALIESL